MEFRSFRAALSVLCLLGSAQAATATLAHLEPSQPDGAVFRWWIPAAFADTREIDRELTAIAASGFRGVEICVDMSDSSYPKAAFQQKGWESPAWAALYRHILQTGTKLGLKIDSYISPAWPAAVPTISPEDDAASKELLTGVSAAFSGPYNGTIPAPQETSPGGMAPPGGPPPGAQTEPNVPNRPVLVAVVAARITGNAAVTKIQARSWGDTPPEPRPTTQTAALLDPASLTVVTTQNGRVQFTPPTPGQWKLFAFWMKGTAQQDKSGGSTFTPNFVVDHYGPAGAKAMIDFWNSHFLSGEGAKLLRENGGSIFEDSLELEYKGLPWTPAMLAAFKRRRGYDLTRYLPLLTGASLGGMANVELYPYEFDDGTGHYSALGDRIRTDYAEAMTQLYLDDHVDPLQNWAHSNGMGYRAQSYGEAFDLSATAVRSSGPDVESLGFGPGVPGDDRFRIIAGGAHSAAHMQLADEVGALANLGYRLDWRTMLQLVDRNITDGATRMVFHGFPYAESNSSVWPGMNTFGFSLAGEWGPRNPDWVRIRDLGDYLSRIQKLLLAGTPKMDVAVVKLQYGTSAPIFTDQGMEQAGYGYDIISPALLGMNFTNGPAYRALVLDQESTMTPAAAQQLVTLVQNGIKLVIVGAPPSHAPYFANWQQQDSALAVTIAQLVKLPGVRQVQSESAVPAALRDLGVQPAIALNGNPAVAHLHFQHNNADFYFLDNTSNNPVTLPLQFAGQGETVQIDLWDGAATKLSNTNSATITLAPGESTLFATGTEADLRRTLAGGFLRPHFETASTIQLSGPWNLSIESWQDAHNPQHTSATNKTALTPGPVDLISWSKIPSVGNKVSGIGTYRTTLTLPSAPHPGQPVILDLGRFTGASIAAWINGTRRVVDQFTSQADITGLLKSGNNQIQIELTTTLGNRLIADGKLVAPAWNPGMKVLPADYGVFGPVEIKLGK